MAPSGPSYGRTKASEPESPRSKQLSAILGRTPSSVSSAPCHCPSPQVPFTWHSSWRLWEPAHRCLHTFAQIMALPRSLCLSFSLYSRAHVPATGCMNGSWLGDLAPHHQSPCTPCLSRPNRPSVGILPTSLAKQSSFWKGFKVLNGRTVISELCYQSPDRALWLEAGPYLAV